VDFADGFIVRLIAAMMPDKPKSEREVRVLPRKGEYARTLEMYKIEEVAYRIDRYQRTGFATRQEEDEYYDTKALEDEARYW
jgi:hypothetical protein